MPASHLPQRHWEGDHYGCTQQARKCNIWMEINLSDWSHSLLLDSLCPIICFSSLLFSLCSSICFLVSSSGDSILASFARPPSENHKISSLNFTQHKYSRKIMVLNLLSDFHINNIYANPKKKKWLANDSGEKVYIMKTEKSWGYFWSVADRHQMLSSSFSSFPSPPTHADSSSLFSSTFILSPQMIFSFLHHLPFPLPPSDFALASGVLVVMESLVSFCELSCP